MDDVEAHVARAGDPHHGVEVGPVVVERRPDAVHDAGDLLDVGVEEPERVRVREHEAGHVLVRLRAQVVEVDAAVRRRADLHDLVARHRHRRRVGAVGRVRRQHLGALLAAVLVVGARQQEAGELPVRAGARLERDVRQAGDLGERALEAPHQLERPLRLAGILQRVQAGVARQRRHALVQLGVVLHRAGAERVEALVEMEVLRGERRVVAHELGLGDLGQLRRPLAAGTLRQELLDRYLRHLVLGRRRHERPPALARALEDRDRVALAHAGTPSRVPATTRASRSICSFVRRSVIATSRPSSYSG